MVVRLPRSDSLISEAVRLGTAHHQIAAGAPSCATRTIIDEHLHAHLCEGRQMFDQGTAAPGGCSANQATMSGMCFSKFPGIEKLSAPARTAPRF